MGKCIIDDKAIEKLEARIQNPFLVREEDSSFNYMKLVKQGYDDIFQKALQQILDSLRDKGLETANPNFSCLGLQDSRPTDPNIENPIQYIFSLRGRELGRFWFTNVWTGTSVSVTPHLTWVEGVDEIIERLL